MVIESNSQPEENFTIDQWRYIDARLEYPEKTRAQVARYLGIPANTMYRWKEAEAYVNAAVKSVAHRALKVLEEQTLAAAQIKAEGLKSVNEDVRQKVASEILDRVLGKAMQRTDVTSGGDALRVIIEWTDADSEA